MSSNLDLLRSILAEWGRGDFSSSEWAHPEIEFIRPDGPAPGRWTGLDGLAEATRALVDAWQDFRFHGDEFRELDANRVLVLIHFTGRGRSSGLDVEQIGTKGAGLFHFRDGKVVRVVHYLDRERALRELGELRRGATDQCPDGEKCM